MLTPPRLNISVKQPLEKQVMLSTTYTYFSDSLTALVVNRVWLDFKDATQVRRLAVREATDKAITSIDI